jgi:hypothetical protein
MCQFSEIDIGIEKTGIDHRQFCSAKRSNNIATSLHVREFGFGQVQNTESFLVVS